MTLMRINYAALWKMQGSSLESFLIVGRVSSEFGYISNRHLVGEDFVSTSAFWKAYSIGAIATTESFDFVKVVTNYDTQYERDILFKGDPGISFCLITSGISLKARDLGAPV